MQNSVDIEASLSRFRPACSDQFSVFAAEAEFGWDEIRGAMNDCNRGLEIGAGSGFLAYLAACNTSARITAIEPLADGFGGAESMLEQVRQAAPDNLTIDRSTLEEFAAAEPFDLIWSVNVFEHLPDWQAALLRIRDLLAPGGRAVLLFPNYDFPYEPHFRLPLIGGRKLTRRLFARRIERYEAENNAAGLWASLNFVKAGELMRFARANGLDLAIDTSITVRMFERLKRDRQLQARQAWLAGAASACRVLNLHRAWAALPAVMQPYLRMEFRARLAVR